MQLPMETGGHVRIEQPIGDVADLQQFDALLRRMAVPPDAEVTRRQTRGTDGGGGTLYLCVESDDSEMPVAEEAGEE